MQPRRMRESSLFTIFLLFVNSGIFNFQPIRTHYFHSYFAHYLLAGCLLAYYVPLSMYLKRNENNKKLLFLINSGTLQKQQFSPPLPPHILEKHQKKMLENIGCAKSRHYPCAMPCCDVPCNCTSRTMSKRGNTSTNVNNGQLIRVPRGHFKVVGMQHGLMGLLEADCYKTDFQELKKS